MQATLTTVAATLLFVALAYAVPPDFKITTEKREDRVVATAAEGKTLFTIQSPSGIGAATITRTKDTWPKTIIVRLHLAALERFAFAYGKTTISASVASYGDRSVRLHADEDGNERDVEKGGPLWMEVRIADARGKPTLAYPLENGYFEIVLPAALARDQPRTITLSWIDSYRG